MSITRICLVRHGETSWNAERRLQGHVDIPLNPTGESQASAAARALRNRPFDAIYSSDLLRARSTAEAIAREQGGTVQIETGLRERHFGVFQGLTREEADIRWPGEYARVRTREPEAVPPGGGESLLLFGERVRAAAQRIAQAHPGGTVLIVSHGGCLDALYRMATGQPINTARDFPLGNATLNWIEFDQAGWRVACWDDRAHLERSADELEI